MKFDDQTAFLYIPEKIVSLPNKRSMSDITTKNYRKLALRVSETGFSFAVTDTLNQHVLSLKVIDFPVLPGSQKTEDLYWKAFLQHKELTADYDDVVVLHNSGLNTFVPQPLFDETFSAGYLQFNNRVFETDFFAHDTIVQHHMVNVYIPFVNLNNYLIDQFGPFEYRHSASTLVPKLLESTKNQEDKKVFAHFSGNCFEIIVAQNQKLLFYNSFDYTTKEDFIYYLLFTAEQLQLNPETFSLRLLGSISKDDDCFGIAYQYVRDTQLFDTSALAFSGNITPEEARQHFILVQA